MRRWKAKRSRRNRRSEPWETSTATYLIFETFRHALLAKVLGIPQWCVGTGFRDIEQDDAPPGLERSELRRTGDGA